MGTREERRARWFLAALGLAVAAGPAAAQRAKAPGKPAPEKAVVPTKVVACASLANLRILMTETAGDAAAIKARLADPKADHLGCARFGSDRVEGNAERVVVGGTAYDCLKVKESSLCRWALSGVPAEAP
ncbi:hypothetical protein SAMN04487843_107189 [Methylobacterium sp. ap11]|nr:hypothetical protein SAMN04487843_107189 [Methylobacterium sp. ap11]